MEADRAEYIRKSLTDDGRRIEASEGSLNSAGIRIPFSSDVHKPVKIFFTKLMTVYALTSG